MFSQRRSALLITTAFLGLMTLSAASAADGTERTFQFDIPAESLSQALSDFSQVSSQQIIFSEDLLKGHSIRGLHGNYTASEALNALLSGTGLRVETDTTGVLMIKKAERADAGNNGLDMETIVVTGTAAGMEKMKAAYSVSTMDKADIAQRAPKSLVDLLRSTPGITVENSGGEGGGENTVVRGLPYSGFRLLDVLVDGLPLFESNYERQLQVDELFRVDANTTGLQVVRGGTAPIFSNNASGGVVNFLTNHGTEIDRRTVSLTANGNDQLRIDAAASGPISGNLLYSVSGFFRRDNGLRSTGFANADFGGQLQAGATYIASDNLKITADFRYLNDRTVFYSDIPLSNPNTGQSLAGLIDPHYGTLTSNSERFVAIKTLDGKGNVVTLHRDLRDGIAPKIYTGTVGVEYNEGGWLVSDKARYTNGDVGFNAIFNGSATDATAYLSNRLAAAKSAFPNTSSLRYVLAGTNTVYDPAATQNLVMPNTWNASDNKYSEFVNDLRVSKTFDTGSFGKHDLTAGISTGWYTFNSVSLNNTIINNVKNQPLLLDVQALDSSGNVTGMVTDNGFASYGTQLNGNVHGIAVGIYGSETWHVTDDFQIDINARVQNRSELGNRGILGNVTSTTGSVATRSINGVTSYAPYKKYYSNSSWSVGSLYQISDNMNVFARFTSTFSLPRLSDMWTNNNCSTYGVMPNCKPVPTLNIKQAEGGFKLNLDSVQVYATGFWSHLTNFNQSTYVVDTNPSSSTYEQLVTQNLIVQTTTYGLELEAAWHPVDFFALNGSLVWQSPTMDGGQPFNTGYSAALLEGKTLPRDPRLTFTIEPTIYFDVFGRPARIFGTFFYQGKRYQDAVDTGVLEAYSTVDLGANVALSDMLDLQVLGTNIGNSSGLTEGNARGAVSNSLTQADATVGRPIFGRTWTASLTAHF